MQLGMGVLGWPPQVFWDSSVTELYAAMEGWQDKMGIERTQTLSGKEIDDIQKMIDKFPDDPKSDKK